MTLDTFWHLALAVGVILGIFVVWADVNLP